MDMVIKSDIKSIAEAKYINWNKLDGKRILITGATGFFSRYIIETLMYRNREYNSDIKIIAMCRNEEKANILYGEYYNDENITFVFQDVTSDIDVEDTVDYIIHTASPASTYKCVDNTWGTVSANVNGFNKVVECAKKCNTKRVLFFSSYSVYGSQAINGKPNEQAACLVNMDHGIDIYSLSKLLCEAMGKSYQDMVEFVSVRPSTTYGPGDTCSRKRLMTDAIDSYLKNEPIIIKSDGTARRNFIYISDAVEAVFLVLLEGENGGIYNIASDEEIAILDLMKIFTKFEGCVGYKFLEGNKAKYIQNSYNVLSADNSKLKQLYNGAWREKVSLTEGIKRTIEWARGNDYFSEW